MKHSLTLLQLTAILCFCTTDGQHGNLSSHGSEFFVGFLRHPPGTDQLNLQLHILTQLSSPVQFNIRSLTGSYNHTGLTSAGSMQAVSIPAEFHTSQNTYNQRHNGLRITTLETESVSVIAYSWRSGDYAAYYAWPCHEQPTTEYVYHVVSLLSTAQTILGDDSVSEFLLVGCQDNTSITVTPSQDIKLPEDPQVEGSPDVIVVKGTSRSFTLHQLQTLLIAEAGVDLSGTKISSNKPITVLSGHEIAQVPLGAPDGDPVVTQLTPTISWGKQFLVPTDEKTSGRLLKLTASENDTVVDMQCGTSICLSIALATAGSIREVELNSSDYCGAVSNKPVYLAVFGRSSSENDGEGDPYLISIPPLEQYAGTVQVSTSSIMGLLDVTNTIIMPANGFFNQTVLLDNSLFTLQPWKEIFFPNSMLAGYGSTSLHGNSYQTLSHPNKHGTLFVSVYGYQSGTPAEFGYSAGAMQYPIATTPILPEITFTLTEYTVGETMGQVKVTLERNRKFEGTVTVQFETSPHPLDTATAGVDYEMVSSLITFQAEQVMAEVIVAINDDQYAEPVEHFTSRIEAVEGCVVFPITEAVVHINDDDSVRIEITKGDISLESREILVSTDVTNGILQYDQEVDIELTLDVLGVTSFPPTSLLFSQHTHGFITRFALLTLDIGQTSVLRATVKLVEAQVTMEIGNSLLIVPATIMASSNMSVIIPTPSASASCSQTDKELVPDCILAYTGTALLVGISALELMASLICCWVCYRLGRRRQAEQRTHFSKKPGLKNRPLPDIPMDYTMNPTYNICQEPIIPSDMQNPLILDQDSDTDGDTDNDGSDEMMDNPLYNQDQNMASLDLAEHLDLTRIQQQSKAPQEPRELEYSYVEGDMHLSQGFGHHDSTVEISDIQPLIENDEDPFEENAVHANTTAGDHPSLSSVQQHWLQAAKCPQDRQGLPTSIAYQNIGSHRQKMQLGTKYQNIGHRKNPSQESTEKRNVGTHLKKSQPKYLNTGFRRKQSEGGAIGKSSEPSGEDLSKPNGYQNTAFHQQQGETNFQNIRPLSSKPMSYQNTGRDDHSQQWLSSMGTIKSDEHSLSGHHATYDLLTYQIESSDDQQSNSSTSDYAI